MQEQLKASYDEFCNTHNFVEKAGFNLTELQWKDALQFKAWRFSLNRYEVGGGKTVVSTVVSLLGDAETTLVVVLPILVTPWRRWLERFDKDVLVYRGDKESRKLLNVEGRRWIITSHALFRNDFRRLYEALKGKHMDLIVDEAHWLKNIESKLYQCVGVMSNRPQGSLQLLTGTPTSKPEDVYAYLVLCRLKFYRNYVHFENSHVLNKSFMGSDTTYKHLDVLSKRFEARSIVRTKEEVHNYSIKPLFPDTTYTLSKEHMDFYTQVMEEQLVQIADDKFVDATTATKLYHIAQQLIVNWGYFTEDPTHISAAYDLIDATIEETNCMDEKASKLIIWTQYKITSTHVLNYCRNKYGGTVAAYGEVDSELGTQTFMNDPKARIGVFQYQSAGAGLNPQAVCWESLFLETNTVPLYVTQAMGRIDRVGQEHIPSMRFAIAEGTVQVGLVESLLKKDDSVVQVERSKKSLRSLLFGRIPA